MMTDPVADLLARIRNAGKAHHPEIVCPSSKLKLAIAKVLSAEGYLGDVRVEKRDDKDVLVMRVRYDGSGRALIAGLRRVSRPGRRVYVASGEIPEGAQRARRGRDLHLEGRGSRSRGAGSVGGRRAALRGLVAMSRVGRKPIPIPSGVSVEALDGGVRVKGPKGTLTRAHARAGRVRVEGGKVSVARSDEDKTTRALHGLARALIQNMVRGVVEPFVKELEIQGVGYRADVAGKTLKLLLGFSHPVELAIPEGLKIAVDKNVMIRIEGIDRQQVGQFAADLRRIRPPEPYKGKGIRYVGERVRRKVGKAGAA